MASGAVRRQDIDDIAVLTLAAPGGIDAALVAELGAALEAALAAPSVRAVVLTGQGPQFCAAPADDLPPPSPGPMPRTTAQADLAALCARIAAAPRPVIAAVQGRVASGGLALALACRLIVAAPDVVFSLPEARLGLLPPGNAAVRLAWRIGAGPTLALVGGRTLPADEAMRLGLVAAMGPPLVTALAVLAAPLPVPGQPGLADPAGFAAALAQARAQGADPRALDCVEAALLLPPDQALTFDSALADEAARLPEARAAAHLARARRRLAAVPGALPAAPVLAAMDPAAAAQWLPPLLRAGASVILHAPDRDTLARALESVAEAQLSQVRAGTRSQAESEADWLRLSGRLTLDSQTGPALADAAHAGWLAGVAPQAAPLVVWGDEGAAPPGALLALPAPTRPAVLCELVAPPGTGAEALATGLGLVRALGFLALPVTGESAVTALVRAVARVAACLRASGVPVETLVATGLVPEALAQGTVAAPAPLPLPPARLIALAVAAEGLRLLGAGVVRRPSDIDLAAVLAAGWPARTGGPMAMAAALGPLVLRHELRQAAALDAGVWADDPLLSAMIRRGTGFAALDAG